MKRNLGDNRLPKRRRSGNPMQTYDGLPREVRAWVAEAKIPWSPAACRKIWLTEMKRGASIEAVLEKLDQAEDRTLARENRKT